MEGKQNIELLPNATGVVCQTVDVAPGATYKLSFYYGRLQTFAWRNQVWFTAARSLEFCARTHATHRACTHAYSYHCVSLIAPRPTPPRMWAR